MMKVGFPDYRESQQDCETDENHESLEDPEDGSTLCWSPESLLHHSQGLQGDRSDLGHLPGDRRHVLHPRVCLRGGVRRGWGLDIL